MSLIELPTREDIGRMPRHQAVAMRFELRDRVAVLRPKEDKTETDRREIDEIQNLLRFCATRIGSFSPNNAKDEKGGAAPKPRGRKPRGDGEPDGDDDGDDTHRLGRSALGELGVTLDE